MFIDGQFSITVEAFTMQVLGTCDVTHHLLPIAVCVATSSSPLHGPSVKSVPKDLHRKALKGDKVCAVFTHHLRTGDKGYLHWGKVSRWRAQSAQSSSRLIRNPVLIPL